MSEPSPDSPNDDEWPSAEDIEILSGGFEGEWPVEFGCPPPTKWKLYATNEVKTGLTRVSDVVIAGAVPTTVLFTVNRTVEWSTAVTAGVKAGIGVIEAETGISLQKTVRISVGQTLRFTVPKGARMALFAGCLVVNRIFRRTVYSSAGPCYPVEQKTVVSSPKAGFLEARPV